MVSENSDNFPRARNVQSSTNDPSRILEYEFTDLDVEILIAIVRSSERVCILKIEAGSEQVNHSLGYMREFIKSKYCWIQSWLILPYAWWDQRVLFVHFRVVFFASYNWKVNANFWRKTQFDMPKQPLMRKMLSNKHFYRFISMFYHWMKCWTV